MTNSMTKRFFVLSFRAVFMESVKNEVKKLRDFLEQLQLLVALLFYEKRKNLRLRMATSFFFG